MPLDLIFIGQDGSIRDILPGEPFSEALISPGEPVRFVLELKRGTAEKAGIKDGDLVRHPAINEAARQCRLEYRTETWKPVSGLFPRSIKVLDRPLNVRTDTRRSSGLDTQGNCRRDAVLQP